VSECLAKLLSTSGSTLQPGAEALQSSCVVLNLFVTPYSVRKFFTGFASAALTISLLITISAIT